jgi:hypothetical protein
MANTSDADWAEIKLVSGLPDAARDEYTAESTTFFEDREEEFEVRFHRTEKAVNDALKLVKKLPDLLSILKMSKNYRCYNTDGVPLGDVELEETWRGFDRLLERLSGDSERFKKKNMRERDQIRLNRRVRWLLKYQQRWLNTKLPVEAQETATSVQFRAYVEKCCEDCRGSIDRALKTVTSEFARQRKTTRG